ncbi:MAG: hypothetical protein Q7T29_03845 [Gallionella sp.]|nr:hypothetical protein [Gallionella sp.]
MTNTEQQIAEDGHEISLNDIIDFFVTKWKIFLMGAFFGLLIALGGTLLLGKYEAEATLINKSNIDYLTWKSLKRNLPILAAGISEATNSGEDFLRALSSETWWQKNAVPTFAIGKEDAKFGMPKEMQDAESIKIKDFVVTAAGPSKEDAIKNLSTVTSFLRSGAAYLALKDVIANYQIELLNSESENAKNISTLEIELTYLNDRMGNLELLKAKFPGNSASTIAQPMDPKDSSAKYLPIITQLIAVNKDISALKENLSRLTSRKSQLAITNDFLLQAMPVIGKNFDGLSAVAELMRIESGMRKDLQASDWNKVSMLNNIKYDLVSIHTRFTLGLEQPTYINTRKPHYLKPAAIGLAAGFILALLFSLCSVIWFRYLQQKR